MDDSLTFPGAFLSTPGFRTIAIIVLSLQIISCIAFIAILLEYRFIHNRQHAFLSSMDDREGIARRRKHLVTILYVAVTLVLLVVTTVIFLFQPHLL